MTGILPLASIPRDSFMKICFFAYCGYFRLTRCGQLELDVNLIWCLKDAPNRLLTLFWELVVCVELAGMLAGPAGSFLLRAGSAELRWGCSRPCPRRVSLQLLWANLFLNLFIPIGIFLFYATSENPPISVHKHCLPFFCLSLPLAAWLHLHSNPLVGSGRGL